MFRYNRLVLQYSDVIVGQFFGHQNSDAFRIFKDNKSKYLLTPAAGNEETDIPPARSCLLVSTFVDKKQPVVTIAANVSVSSKSLSMVDALKCRSVCIGHQLPTS